MTKIVIIILLLLSYSVIPVLAHVISEKVEYKAEIGYRKTDNGKLTTENVPHLRLDSGYLDIGVIPHDSIAEGVMRFRNTGNAPLQILRVFSDCGCTSPSYSSEEVMPGDTGVIRVRFNGKHRDPGIFRKILRIRSNADNPREYFYVKGRILPK